MSSQILFHKQDLNPQRLKSFYFCPVYAIVNLNLSRSKDILL